MTIYARMDAEGRALGFFMSDINPIIPDDAVEISAELHRAWAADTARQRLVNGALEPCEALPGPPIRTITALAFRRRLSTARRAAITLAASQAMEQGDATIQTWLDDLAASRVVDLDDAETVAGLAALLTANVITQQEHDALLSNGTREEAR